MMSARLEPAVKTAVGVLVQSRLLRTAVCRSARRTANILYYHHVGASTPHYQAFHSGCTASKFARDLQWLSSVFEIATLGDIIACGRDDTTLERPRLAITFDDGFDVRTSGVMQILDDCRVRATTFVITSCIDNQRMMWRHMLSAIQALTREIVWRREFNELSLACHFRPTARDEGLLSAAARWDMRHKDEWAALLWSRCGLPPLREYLEETRPYFTWTGLEQWLAAGHSVGFHTHTHPFCSQLQHADMDHELVQPALDLKRRLGISQLPLSYPFGDRLQPALERTLFDRGIFQALLGIKGFSPRGTPNEKLERAGAEADHIGWTLFRSALVARSPARRAQGDAA